MNRGLAALLLLPLALASASAADGPAAATKSSSEEIEELPVMQIEAGVFPIGAAPHALLNSLEIVMTPGANADINRTLQSFPGVQSVDDGNALFVRGGDSYETSTLVNGIRYPDAVRLDAPAGTYTGTINPFQAEKISFLAGGYGARYGNTLSAVVELDTPGVPTATEGALNLSIGHVSLGASHPFSHSAGARFTAGLFDLDPLFSLHAPAREFPEPPSGHDLSAILAWHYRPGAHARTFLIEQETEVGLVVREPGYSGTFRSRVRNRLGTLSVEDRLGPWDITTNLGGGSLERWQSVRRGDTTTIARHRQINLHAARDLGETLRLSTGAEWNTNDFTLAHAVPAGGAETPSSVTRRLREKRLGGFAELSGVTGTNWLLAGGVRADHSRLADETTVDPRVRVSWQPRTGLNFSAAAGTYHQVADPYDYARPDGGTNNFPAMRATHALLSVQLGDGERQVRIETYEKKYARLVELTRTFEPVGGGRGRARGVDLFAKVPLPGEWKGRATWSLIDSERTDPNTRQLARSPQDITHTIALIADRRWRGWNLGFAWRYASGRPITPVIGAAISSTGEWILVYGSPTSERLPATSRFDFSVSRLWGLSDHVAAVTYLSLNNIFNESNTTGYEYADDFARRTPVPSLFARTAYFGVSFIFR